jgi:outer membrane receptor protein involved in Fe transport
MMQKHFTYSSKGQSKRVLLYVMGVTGFLLNTIAWESYGQHLASDQLKDRKISISLIGASLESALTTISKESGWGIVFDHADVSEHTTVTVSEKNISVQDAVKRVLASTLLAFREQGNTIVIYKMIPAKQSTTGVISGFLKDSNTNEVLIGASVKVVGTTQGATTDINGWFSIKLPSGTYQLALSYIGYETMIVRDVTVQSAQTVTVNYKLKESAMQLQAIEIIGNRALAGNVVQSNEVSLINEIKTSSLIVTGISAQQIARSVDQDAGDVARRLPGVAVLNNFVNIRGMHERYNLTFLNGMVAPSAEADRRAFSYDLMPSNMIDKMTVYRSPGPELLGDWAGGVIKIDTKNTAIARQLEANFSTWYRPGSNFSDYYTYQGGNRDWLGVDDGTRALPHAFPAQGEVPAGGYNDVDFDNQLRDESKLALEDLAANAALGRQLYNNWNLQRATSGLDYRAGINYYDAWNIKKMRLSNLTSINTTQATQIIFQDFAPLRRINNSGSSQLQGRYYNDTISQRMARWGILQNLALSISPSHTIEAKALYNQMGIDETLVRDGFDDLDQNAQFERRILYTYRSRSVLSTQLTGLHTMESNIFKWTVGYAYSGESIPAQREMMLIPEILDNPDLPKYLASRGGGFSTVSSLFYNDSNEKNFTYSLDYEKKFPSGFFVRAGFFNEVKSREQDGRMIAVINDSPAREPDLTEFSADRAYSNDQFLDDGSGVFIYDNYYLSGLFDVEAMLRTGYAAINVPLFTRKLNVYAGVRYEGQDLVMTAPGTFGDFYNFVNEKPAGSPVIDRYLYYWLPSVNTSWSFSENLLLRLAYGRTLNRPNFRELMPFSINDPRLQQAVVGNATLQDAHIDNIDLRLEHYPGEGQFISLGAFYKSLENAIEPYVNPEGNRIQQFFANTPRATVYGLEAEVRKSLNFTPWAKGLSLILNAAVQRSKVEFQDGLLVGGGDNIAENFNTNTRPLEGTAPYVINAGLYYDIDKWGTKFSAMYNVLGQRLVFAGTPIFPETYERPRHVLDLTIRQRINKTIELRAGVQDILNQQLMRYRDYDRNQRWSQGERSKWPYKDYVFQQFRPGSYYMLGVNVTL